MRIAYKDELCLYRKHHLHLINWFIHVVCIFIEWFSYIHIIAIFLCYQSSLSTFLLVYGGQASLAVYAIICKPGFIGILVAVGHVFIAFMSLHSAAVDLYINNTYWLMIISIVAQLLSWFMQVFVGHFMIEKNKPSMTQRLSINSVVLSLLLAWDYS